MGAIESSHLDDGNCWTLGLVVLSYVRSESRQLMHVVVLDDGKELHVRSSDVDHILVLNQCLDDVDSEAPAHNLDFKVPGGHASSQEGVDSGPS